MPNPGIDIQKLRELIRLSLDVKLSNRRISKILSVSRKTVGNYVRRLKSAGLIYETAKDLGDADLQALLLSRSAPIRDRPVPDWVEVKNELAKKNVTLMLLWDEYIEKYPEGYAYSRFCGLFRKWNKSLDCSMRQTHKAGEKLFVDWAGTKVPIHDSITGEVHEACVFVATMGASNYTYAEAFWTMELQDWIEAHVRAFSFLGGVPDLTVPDNPKTGVTKACFYDPVLNRTYAELAEHYNTTIVPTRVRKPKDKAIVENGVGNVSRRILAALRNRRFYSLAELNKEILRRRDEFNNRSFQKMPGCRRTRFETIDKPALKPLPKNPFVFGVWRTATVHIDYHIEIERHYYSVPYEFRGKKVNVRTSARTIEIFYNNKRVASHIRKHLRPGTHTTLAEHMPSNHRKYNDWSPERFRSWARKIGSSTEEVIISIFESRNHPEQAFRSCLGVLHLTKKYSSERLEAACRRALKYKCRFSRKTIECILKNNRDKMDEQEEAKPPIQHDNIRGPEHFGTDDTNQQEEEECCIIPLFKSSMSCG